MSTTLVLRWFSLRGDRMLSMKWRGVRILIVQFSFTRISCSQAFTSSLVKQLSVYSHIWDTETSSGVILKLMRRQTPAASWSWDLLIAVVARNLKKYLMNSDIQIIERKNNTKESQNQRGIQLTGLLESHRNKINLDVNILCCEKKLVFSPELLDFLLKKSSFLPIKNINCTQKYTFIICNIMTDVIHPVNSYLSICSCYSCLRVLHLMFTLRCLNWN